jgi:hypothetical protein
MSETSLTTTIRPVIEGEHIIYVEIGYEPLPLVRPIHLNDFPDFVSKVQALSEYVNFEGKTGWTLDEIHMFLHVDITNKARRFFEILAQEGGWVRREEIQSRMNIVGRALAGILSSPGQYFSRWRKDHLYEMENRLEEDDDEERPYYQIKPLYLDDVKQALEEE